MKYTVFVHTRSDMKYNSSSPQKGYATIHQLQKYSLESRATGQRYGASSEYALLSGSSLSILGKALEVYPAVKWMELASLSKYFQPSRDRGELNKCGVL